MFVPWCEEETAAPGWRVGGGRGCLLGEGVDWRDARAVLTRENFDVFRGGMESKQSNKVNIKGGRRMYSTCALIVSFFVGLLPSSQHTHKHARLSKHVHVKHALDTHIYVSFRLSYFFHFF